MIKMTDQERDVFLKQVKGKKIRWCTWHLDNYFIPNGKRDDSQFHGQYYRDSSASGNYASWHISGGLNGSSSWEFYTDPLPGTDGYHKTIPKGDIVVPRGFEARDKFKTTDVDILRTGVVTCQCGAAYTSNPSFHYKWCPKHG